MKFKVFLQAFVLDWNVWIYLSLIIFSFLGLIRDPAFYCYCLILILWENKLTLNVLGSVVIHIDQVLATICLSFVVLYWYTIVAYNSSWRGSYTFEDKMVDIYYFNNI